MAAPVIASADAAANWFAERGVRALKPDSRKVRPGDAFIAWPGHAIDARRFVGDALAAGAAACLVDADGAAAFDLPDDGRVALFSGLKAATGRVASAFMGEPSRRLKVIACTGTNGKTSTAWWTAQALSALGRRCGVIGTLGVGAPPSTPEQAGEMRFTGLTTPDPVTLQRAFRQFADDGFAACAIEASSIGINEERLAGTRIDLAQFTNFTQDHLDYHGSMEAYWEAKARLFAWPQLRAAVVNVGDAHGRRLAASLAARRTRDPLDVWTFSTEPMETMQIGASAGADAVDRPARLRASEIRQAGGLRFIVHEGAEHAGVATRLIGAFNAANVLAVIGALRALGVSLVDASYACRLLTPVPGRMQRVDAEADEPAIVIDYAHTPDALEKVLLALQPLARERGGALWCVFGCGGNRDAAKRPLMGAAAARYADRVVFTSDNPRLEDPAAILAQIVGGVGVLHADARADDAAAGGDGAAHAAVPARTAVIENRATAIDHAVCAAAPVDVILVAGKGHEDYQDVAGTRYPFSDLAQALAALGRRRRSGASC